MQPSITTLSDASTTIFHGDSVEVMRERIPDGRAALVFADPPYNIGKSFGAFKDKWPSDEEYADWCYIWLELCLRKLTPTGSMYVMTSTQAMPLFDLWLRKRCTVQSRIVWHYDSSGVQARRYFGSMYEPILFCVKNPKKYTFNAEDIGVEARTGAVRKLIDYRKPKPTPYKTTKVPGNAWYFPRVRYRMGCAASDWATNSTARSCSRSSRHTCARMARAHDAEPPHKGTSSMSSSVPRHAFTGEIETILLKHFGENAADVFERSPLLGYLNHKTKSANRGSKSRGSFANHYALSRSSVSRSSKRSTATSRSTGAGRRMPSMRRT